MRFISSILVALALLISLTSAVAIPDTTQGNTDVEPTKTLTPIYTSIGSRSPTATPNAYCGYIYAGRNAGGSYYAALVTGQGYGFNAGFQSGIISNGCHCSFWASPRCTGNPYFNINNAWQGNFPGAIQCYYCDLGQREARGLPESPVIDDVQMAESTALPPQVSAVHTSNGLISADTDDTNAPPACGYIYESKDFREGRYVVLYTNGRFSLKTGYWSGQISNGCRCDFYNNEALSGRPFARIEKAWQGNFDDGVRGFYCALGKREARGMLEAASPDGVDMAEPTGTPTEVAIHTSGEPVPADIENIPACGLVYVGKGSQGSYAVLNMGRVLANSNDFRSAKIRIGCQCAFWNNAVATGNPFITIRNAWQGEYAPIDFAQVVHAFYCDAIHGSKEAREAETASLVSKEQAIPTPPPGEVVSPDHDGPIPVDGAICGYMYQNRDLIPGGAHTWLGKDGPRVFNEGMQSGIMSNGCVCSLWGNKECNGGPFLILDKAWQGNFIVPTHCYVCKLTSTVSERSAISTPLPAEAVNTTDHDGPPAVDAQFCGIAYEYRDMQPGNRGQLESGSALHFTFGFNSVQIINGCECAFWGNKECNGGVFITIKDAFQGNLIIPGWCFFCNLH